MLICENTKNFLTSFRELSIGDIFKDELNDGQYYMRLCDIDICNQWYNCVHLQDGGLDRFSETATVRKINTAKLVVE